MADDGYRFLSVETSDAMSYVLDKDRSCREFATYFLARVMKMFKWENLPEEIPEDCFNKMLLTEGFVFFTKYKSTNLLGENVDQYYVFRGNMGGIIDAYYRPTHIIVANPGANCFETFDLGKQKGGTYYGDKGVIIRNDTLFHGLMPLIKRYAYLLAENILTMRTADVFLRILALISGQDDKTLLSANQYIKAIEEGKMMAVAEGTFFEGVKMQSPPSNNGSYLTQFIEYQQYFLGSFFNEIGLNANFNMKRESIAKSESSLNEDSMLPLCQNMLMCRQQDIDVVNEMFGLNIKVSFDSAWLQNALEIALELKALANQAQGNGGLNGGFNGGFNPNNQMPNPISQQKNGDDEAAKENQDSEATKSGDKTRGVVPQNAGEGSKGSVQKSGEAGNSGEAEGAGSSAGAEKEGAPEEKSVEDEFIENVDEQIKEAAMLSDKEKEESEEKKDEGTEQEL